MKQLRMHITLLAMVTLVSVAVADSPVPANPVFRDPARNTVDKVTGMYPYHIHLTNDCTDKDFYWTFSTTVKYGQSFRGDRITELLFGNALSQIEEFDECFPKGECESKSCYDGLIISGTGTDVNGNFLVQRGSNDLMAENFYLPRDFKSIVTFNPKVQTVVANFDFFVGLNRFAEGLYFRAFAPVVYAKYNLGMQEEVINAGTVGYAAGFFDAVSVPRSQLLTQFTDYSCGNAPEFSDTAAAVGGNTFTNVFNQDELNVTASTVQLDALKVAPLLFSKMCECPLKKTKFSDVHLELGYEFWKTDDYHLAAGLQVTIPVGSRLEPEFLFTPQTNNGYFWELGGNVNAHYTFWRSKCEDKSFDVILEADITHAFSSKQCRTFDLADKGLSRYMLAQKITSPAATQIPLAAGNITTVTTDAQVTGTVGAFPSNVIGLSSPVFSREYSPVANFSTFRVKVGSSLQTDITVALNYTYKGFNWNLGYNFWMRTCDDIDYGNAQCDEFPEQTWALKGDAYVYGFLSNPTALSLTTLPNQLFSVAVNNGTSYLIGGALNYPVALSATESHADIYTGTNVEAVPSTPNVDANPNIDKPTTTAFDQGSTTFYNYNSNVLVVPNYGTFNGLASGVAVQTTLKPRFISLEDLDLCANSTRGMSNKVFTHFNYTCFKRDKWAPYIGVGAEAEFGRKSQGACCPPKGSGHGCQNAALSQWGVWLKLGMTYY